MVDLKALIETAIEHCGSQAKLAQAAHCSQQYVSLLVQGKTGLSAEMAINFDVATDGKVSKHVLRPDIFGTAPTEQRAAKAGQAAA